jgi:hypothetical protein
MISALKFFVFSFTIISSVTYGCNARIYIFVYFIRNCAKIS